MPDGLDARLELTTMKMMLTMTPALVLLAFAAVPSPAMAEAASSCAATPDVPACSFACAPYAMVKVTVHGSGSEPYLQGTAWCGGAHTVAGVGIWTGYVTGTTVACHPQEPAGSEPYATLSQANGVVLDLLDDGECSTQMFNSGNGVQGGCSLQEGVLVVCEVVQLVPLDG